MEKVSLTSILLVNHRKSLTDKHFACQQGKPNKKNAKKAGSLSGCSTKLN